MVSGRWVLGGAAIAAGIAAGALVAAFVQADGSLRAVIAAALVALVLAAAAAAWWAATPEPTVDPLAERAETASKLAHELNNPLMAIRGLASTGAKMFDQLDDGERREFFTLIDEEAGRLRRVIEQASTAMKVEADQLIYLLNEEDLGTLVESVAWSSPHGDHPMTVDTRPGIVVRADRRYLSEAISNIVENASKYSPPDAPIDVSVRVDDGEAVVEVADRGPGIPSERVHDVFERFGAWRPPGYEETPGAGLGLFLARAHVLAHDGRLLVADREDGGTILRITLPVAVDAQGGRRS